MGKRLFGWPELILFIVISVGALSFAEWYARRFLPEISDTNVVKIQDVAEKYHHPLELSEHLEAPDPEAVRIIFLGDSFTHGICEPKYSFPHLVGDYFNAADVAGIPRRKVQVFNLGSHSYSPSIYNVVLKDYAPKLLPDLVVICVDDSDVQDDYLYTPMVAEDGKRTPISVYPNLPGVPSWLEPIARRIKLVRLSCGVLFKRWKQLPQAPLWNRGEISNVAQVGIFSERYNAEVLCAKLVKEGFDAYIEGSKRGDRVRYLVKIDRGTKNFFVKKMGRWFRALFPDIKRRNKIVNFCRRSGIVTDEIYFSSGENRFAHYRGQEARRWQSAFSKTINLVDKMVDYCEQNNISVALVNYPYPPAVTKRFDSDWLASSGFRLGRLYYPVFHILQRRYAETKRIPYYDFTCYLRSLPDAEGIYYEKDPHFTPKGNMLFAQELVRFLAPLVGKNKNI